MRARVPRQQGSPGEAIIGQVFATSVTTRPEQACTDMGLLAVWQRYYPSLFCYSVEVSGIARFLGSLLNLCPSAAQSGALRVRCSAASKWSLRLRRQAGRPLLMHRTLCRSELCTHGATVPRTNRVKGCLVAYGQSTLRFECAAHPSRAPWALALGSRFSVRCVRGRHILLHLRQRQHGRHEMRRDRSMSGVARRIGAPAAPVGHKYAQTNAHCLCACPCQAKDISHASSRLLWNTQPSSIPLLLCISSCRWIQPASGTDQAAVTHLPLGSQAVRPVTCPLQKASATPT